MDQAVIRYYRNLLKTGFNHAGSLENPSIFLDTVNEKLPICGNIGNYLHLYLYIHNDIIDDIKYLCTCDPTTNVAVEILCFLIKGKTVAAARTISKESFFNILGVQSQELGKKAEGLMDLMNRGFARWH
jgi:NifU-like protein involved in Fe-S cluster formation